MTAAKPPKKAQIIAPEAYPQMVPRAQAGAIARNLKSAVTTVKGARVIDEAGDSLREAMRFYVGELEKAGRDNLLVSEQAHEIRGFADTAGMMATGRIADGLCRYFEECEQAGAVPDENVVFLHVRAILHTARDPDPMNQMNDAVARELAVLARRKRAEAPVPPKAS